MQISKKLTDLPTLSDSEKSVIRNLIDAAKVGDSPVDSGVRKIVQDEIKDLELDSKYVGKAEFAVKQGSSNGLSAYQVGKVVTVSGTVTAPNGTGPWITIPANVDPPKLNLYGSIGRSFGKYDYIRGLSWSCAAGQKTIQVTEQVWQADSVNFCITYLAE